MNCSGLDLTLPLIWEKEAKVMSMIIQIWYVNMLGFLYSTSLIGTYIQKVISFSIFFSLRILGSNLQTCEYDRTQL